ncbi:hypothetical protein [Roseovarius aestuariivivens]|uniref:hypothetical protein n=1 Tax=Roseovarius aestuariivivens TaxID=1888910 RepID=UPI001080A7DC|nr:hypothetical protein [Roseovarius aestuariivivens]
MKLNFTPKPVMFHADLSDAHPGEDYFLAHCGKRHRFVPHTEETLADAIGDAPHQQPHAALKGATHYIEAPVHMPADTVSRIHIRHTMRTFEGSHGEEGISHSAMYFPHDEDAFATGAEMVHATAIDYTSTAKTFLFHHPDLVTKDKKGAATILGLMNNTNIATHINALATQMRMMGQPTETSGWATLEPFVEKSEEANYDPKSWGTYRQHPTDQVQTAAFTPLKMLINQVNNLAALENVKWTVQPGMAVQTADGGPQVQKFATLLALPAKERLSAQQNDEWSVAVANSQAVNQLKFEVSVKDAAKNQINVKFENTAFRYLGLYARFFDAAGKAMSLPNWTVDDQPLSTKIIIEAFDNQYDDMRFIGMISPMNSVYAVPLPPPGETEVTFTFPPGAVSCTLYGSGLGTGADLWPKTPALGGILTAVFNLGVPSMLLAVGAAAQSYKPLYDIVQKLSSNKKVMVAGALLIAAYIGGTSAANRKFNWSAATSVVKFLFESGVGKALAWAELEMAGGAIEDEIPFAGWIMLTINIAATAAQMAETIITIATSPWNIENKVAITISSTVDVFPDPRAQVFPQGSDRKYVVKMIYQNDNRPTVSYEHAVSDSAAPASLQAVFEGNTLGGQVKLEADFYVGDWLAGKATTGWINNNEAEMAQQNLYLVQYPRPLDSKSVYAHTQILTYSGGKYAWKVESTAPTATVASRDNSPTGNHFGDWTGLSLSQRKAMLGIGFQAAGTGLPQCGQTTPGGQLFTFQTVAIPGMLDIAEKFPSCGFAGKSRMVFDYFPPKFLMDSSGNWAKGPDGKIPTPDPKDIDLGEYYIDPRPETLPTEKGGGYHLRKVALDATTPFDMDPAQPSYGRFPLFPDSITLHPSLQVIGVNSSTKKLMVARLQVAGAADTDVPLADFAAGPATDPSRPGLMFYPVAVSCAYDGTILVLEDTSADPDHNGQQVARISAYDLSMNPIERFVDSAGQPTYWLYLSGATGATYVDMQTVGDELMTYIYVLSYKGAGINPSDYAMAVYTYGKKPPAQNPLVTTPNMAAAGLAVDMWHTVYTQNYAMVTDGAGKPAGPTVAGAGPDGRTGPSISMWLPPLPN